MHMRKIIPFILFIGLLLLAAACSKGANTNGEQSQPPEKELSFLFNFASQTIDPHLDYTPLRAGVVETLVKLGEDLQIQPWLARSGAAQMGSIGRLKFGNR